MRLYWVGPPVESHILRRRNHARWVGPGEPTVFHAVMEALSKNPVALESKELSHLPRLPSAIDTEIARKAIRLHDAFDDHDDVHHVYFNATIPNEVPWKLTR